jgi:hypothetical protein
VDEIVRVVSEDLRGTYSRRAHVAPRQKHFGRDAPYHQRAPEPRQPPPPFYPDAEMVVLFAKGMQPAALAAARNQPGRIESLQTTHSTMFSLCGAQMNALRNADVTEFGMHSLAIRALSRPGGVVKYLPTSNPAVPDAYHRADDVAEMREELERKKLAEWHTRGRPNPPATPLLTSVLVETDLDLIFSMLKLSAKELKWLKTRLHSRADGASLVAIYSKIIAARSLSNPHALAHELQQAVTNNIIRFPS